MEESYRKNRKLGTRLVAVTVLMFAFGFLLVPLYDVFCEITGLNGKITNTGALKVQQESDMSRSVRVQLIAVNNEGMPWQFEPAQAAIMVHPGRVTQTYYTAHNPTARKMLAKAIPSVAPAEAAKYLHKVNCFCFERQQLNSMETQQLPIQLMISRELPSHIRTITLSYTLFDITPQPEGLMLVETGAAGSPR
ncbi:MAG: cytochrome c oxidase assembly protein [Chromatiales bacterium]|nr:cytochrome c oxidase assembly protein [Chromatiales bacterium]